MAVLRRKKLGILCVILILANGCAGHTLRNAPSWNQASGRIRTIAVLPADIQVYKLTAGGTREPVDEWSDESKLLIRAALQNHLGARYGYTITFIDEEWLKEHAPQSWPAHKALYSAVSRCALMHAYPGRQTFATKKTVFDYTLGEDIAHLADACGADALLFIHGVNHEATAGRKALLFWNVLTSSVAGVVSIPLNPTFMAMGLADGAGGEILWFKTNLPRSEYTFRNPGSIHALIEWFTRDLAVQK